MMKHPVLKLEEIISHEISLIEIGKGIDMMKMCIRDSCDTVGYPCDLMSRYDVCSDDRRH